MASSRLLIDRRCAGDQQRSVGKQPERVRREERPGVVLLEVEPPDAVVPSESNGPPVQRNFRIRVERSDVRPGLPGVSGRVANRGKVRIWGIAGPCVIGIAGLRGLRRARHAGRSFGHRPTIADRAAADWATICGRACSATIDHITTHRAVPTVSVAESQRRIGLVLDRIGLVLDRTNRAIVRDLQLINQRRAPRQRIASEQVLRLSERDFQARRSM